MRLAAVGVRAGMPAPGQPSSGYVLRTGRTSLLFDCGPGVAGELAAVLPPAELDAVFVSHLHLDHCYDLLPVGKMILAPRVRYPQAGTPAEPDVDAAAIPLHVPTGGRETLRTLQALFPVHSIPLLDRAFEAAFELREYEPGERFTIGDCEIVAVPVRHAVPACGFRVTAPDGTFAYTGDTGWTDRLLDLAEGVDMLLCEATLREVDDGPHGHLSGHEAGRLAALAGVGTLVLTHFTSADAGWLRDLRADAAESFPGRIVLASPGARVIPGR
jgi:ribonuclease BN (tRNA processing enzyme)